MFVWNSLASSMSQWLLAIWSLVPLPFLNPTCTSGSSLLKPNLKDFECNIASLWNEHNYEGDIEKEKKSQFSFQSQRWEMSKNWDFIDYAKAFDSVDHNKLWKILQEVGIPDHLTCFSWNLYADQEVTARTGHGTMDWFQIRKEVRRGCILSPTYLTYMQSISCKMLG